MNEDLRHFLEADSDLSGYLTTLELIAYSKKINDTNFSTKFSTKYDPTKKGYISIDDMSSILKVDARKMIKEMQEQDEEAKRLIRLDFLKRFKKPPSTYTFDVSGKELLKDGKSVGKVKELTASKKLGLNERCDSLFYENEQIGYVSSDFAFTRIRYDSEIDLITVDGFPCGDLVDMFQYNALQFGPSRKDVDITTNYSEKFKQLFAQGRNLGDIDRLYELGFLNLVSDKTNDLNGIYYYDMKVGEIKSSLVVAEDEPPKIKFTDGKKLLLSEHISNGSIKMNNIGKLNNFDSFSVDRATGEISYNGKMIGKFGDLWAKGEITLDNNRDIFFHDERVGYFDDQLPAGKLTYNQTDMKVYADTVPLGQIDNLLEQKSIIMKGLDCYFPKVYVFDNKVYLDRFYVSSYKDAISKKLIKIDSASNRMLVGDIEVSKLPDNLDNFSLDTTPDGVLTKNNSLEDFVNFYKYCPLDLNASRSNASRIFINEQTQELSMDGRVIGKLEDLIKAGRLRVDELNNIITLDGLMLANLPEHVLAPGEGGKYDKSPISFIELFRAATSTRLCPEDGDLFQNGAYIGKLSEGVSNGDVVYDMSSGIISLKDDPIAFVPGELKPAKASLNRTNCEMKLDDGTKGTLESLLEKKKILPIYNYRSAYINEPLRNIYIFDKNVGTVDSFLQQKKISVDPMTHSIWCDSVYLGTLPMNYDISSLIDLKTGIVKTTDPKVFLKAYRETDYYLNSLLEGPNKPTYIKFNPTLTGSEISKLASLSIFTPEGTGTNNTTKSGTSTTTVPGATSVVGTTVTGSKPVVSTTTSVAGTTVSGGFTNITTKSVTGTPVLDGKSTSNNIQETITSTPVKFNYTMPPKDAFGNTYKDTILVIDDKGQVIIDSNKKPVVGTTVKVDDKKNVIYDALKKPIHGYGLLVDQKMNPITDAKSSKIFGQTIYVDSKGLPILDANGQLKVVPQVTTDATGSPIVTSVNKDVKSGVPELLLTNPDGVTINTSGKVVNLESKQDEIKIASSGTTKASADIEILSGNNTNVPSSTRTRSEVNFNWNEAIPALTIDGNQLGNIKSLVDKDKISLNPATKLFYHENVPIKSLAANYSYLGLDYDRDTNSIKKTNGNDWSQILNPYKFSAFNKSIYQNGVNVESLDSAIKSGNLTIDKTTNNVFYKDKFLAPLSLDPSFLGIKYDTSTGKISEIEPKGLHYLNDTTDSPAVFPFIPSKIFDYTLQNGKIFDLNNKEVDTIEKLIEAGRFSIDKDDQVLTLDGKPFTALPYHYFETGEWKYNEDNLVIDKRMDPKIIKEAYDSVNVDMFILKNDALYKNDKKIDSIEKLLKDSKVKANLKSGQILYQDQQIGCLPGDCEKAGVTIDPKSGKITESKPFAFERLLLQGNKERFGNRYSVDYASSEVFLNNEPLGTISKLASKGRFFLDKSSHNILLDGAYFCSLPTNMELVMLETNRNNDTITTGSADSLYVIHYMESVTRNPPEQVNQYHRIDVSKKAIFIDQKDPAQSIEELGKKKAFKVDTGKKEILCNDKWIAHNSEKPDDCGYSVGTDGVISVKDTLKFSEFLNNEVIAAMRLKCSGAYFYKNAIFDSKTSKFSIDGKEVGKLEDLCKQNRLWYDPLKEEVTLDGHYFMDMCQEHVKEYDVKIDPTYGFITQAEPAKFNKLIEELHEHDHHHHDDDDDDGEEAGHHHEHDEGVSVVNLLLNPGNFNDLAKDNVFKVDDYLRIVYAFSNRVGQFSEDQPGTMKLVGENVELDGKKIGTIREVFDKGDLHFNFEDVEASKAFVEDHQCMSKNECHEAFYHDIKEQKKIEFFDINSLSVDDKKEFSFESLSGQIPKPIMEDILTIVKKSYSEDEQERIIAQRIKAYMEKRRGKIWQVVISKSNLGCKVSHMEDMFTNFNYKDLTYIIWKTPRSM